MPVEIFAVPAVGIGRRDYSSTTEFTVEPTIRSYQQVYNNWQVISVPGGADKVVDIAIPGGFVVIVYDFFAAVPDLLLLRLLVETVHSSGLALGIVSAVRYGSIAEHLPKGFPFFQKMRFTVHNYDAVARDAEIGAVGIYTDEEHYYQVLPQAAPFP
jgi:hypothetical protein